MKRKISLVFVLLCCFLLSACNTDKTVSKPVVVLTDISEGTWNGSLLTLEFTGKMALLPDAKLVQNGRVLRTDFLLSIDHNIVGPDKYPTVPGDYQLNYIFNGTVQGEDDLTAPRYSRGIHLKIKDMEKYCFTPILKIWSHVINEPAIHIYDGDTVTFNNDSKSIHFAYLLSYKDKQITINQNTFTVTLLQEGNEPIDITPSGYYSTGNTVYLPQKTGLFTVIITFGGSRTSYIYESLDGENYILYDYYCNPVDCKFYVLLN